MLPGDMGRTGRQWNVISEPYPGLRGYATAYSWNPLRKGLLTGIYVLPNSSRFFSMRFTPLNSRIFLHLNPKSHLLSNLKGRRLQIYLRPFSWLILRLPHYCYSGTKKEVLYARKQRKLQSEAPVFRKPPATQDTRRKGHPCRRRQEARRAAQGTGWQGYPRRRR